MIVLEAISLLSSLTLQSAGYKRNLHGVAVGAQVEAKDKGIIMNNEHMLCFLTDLMRGMKGD